MSELDCIIKILKKKKMYILAQKVNHIKQEKLVKKVPFEKLYELWVEKKIPFESFTEAIIAWQNINAFPDHYVEHNIQNLINLVILDSKILKEWQDKKKISMYSNKV